MNFQDQIAQRRVTQAFINEDVFSVSLTRPTRVADGKGGFTTSPTQLTAQRVRILTPTIRSGDYAGRRLTGELVPAKDHILMGMPNLDVRPGDTLVWNDKNYEVGYVLPDRQIQTLAQLKERGATIDATI